MCQNQYFICVFVTILRFKVRSNFKFSKECSKILEIPGGRGVEVPTDPLEQKFLGGEGSAKQKAFRGGGMDIFWNYTLDDEKMDARNLWHLFQMLHPG